MACVSVAVAATRAVAQQAAGVRRGNKGGALLGGGTKRVRARRSNVVTRASDGGSAHPEGEWQQRDGRGCAAYFVFAS